MTDAPTPFAKRKDRSSLVSTRTQWYPEGFALIEPYGASIPARVPVRLHSCCCFTLTERFDPATMVMLSKKAAEDFTGIQ